MTKPLVSIFILNFNGYKDTNICLVSLEKTHYKNFEVLLLDNGSDKDETKLFKASKKLRIKMFRSATNKGFTGGNNWLLNHAKGKYIVLLNNDTEVDPNWLGPLVELLEKDDKVAIVQPKIKLLSKKTHFDYAGAAGGFIDKYGYPFTRGRVFDTIEKDSGQYDGESKIFWASGAACMIRRSTINKVGGLFKEDLFNYMEEIDLCWRTWNNGFKVMFTSKAVIYHKGAATGGKDLFRKRFWEHRNNLFILARNLNLLNFIKIIPARAFLELGTYVKYLSDGNWTYVKSLLFAHLDFLKKAIWVRYKRARLPNRNDLPLYPKSVVVDYFINTKKTFNDLNWSPKGTIAYIIFKNTKNTGSFIIFTQINDFVKKGYTVRVYSLFGRGQNWFDLKVKVQNISEMLFDSRPDVLIATFWPTAYLALLIPAAKKFMFSQDWGPDIHRFRLFKKAAEIAYSLPFTHMVISNYLKQRILQVNTSKVKPTVVPYRSLDLANYKFRPKRGAIKPSRKIKILSVISWYTHTKGADRLALCALRLKKKYKNRFEFTLVSREKEPYNRLFDNFYSDPPKKTLSQLYQQSDVLLCTSRNEGFFIPGIEAMATGLPFIALKCDGLKQYAKNNFNAVIVNTIADIWGKNIIQTTLQNATLVKTLITNGHKTVQKYDIRESTKEIEELIFTQN